MSLERLNVSLTKHGAYKVAVLLKNYDIKNAISHLHDEELNIDIDEAQAKKNLNYFSSSHIPEYWDKIRLRKDLNIYVLLSIIFSHHELLNAMKSSQNRYGRGIILRDEIVVGKVYTNLANNFEELGYIIEHNELLFEYDISYIFSKSFNVEYFRLIILDKFKNIGIPEIDFEKTLIDNQINGVFGLNESEFLTWLYSGKVEVTRESHNEYWGINQSERNTPFKFVPRHIDRRASPIRVYTKTGEIEVTQLHIKIQNELYKKVLSDSGKENVGTEIEVNYQDKIDLVEKNEISYRFFEIKTYVNDRQNIREALSQLLEYAYWPNTERCNSIVIVAPAKLTEEGMQYLSFLRSKFGIPVFYWWYNQTANMFIQMI